MGGTAGIIGASTVYPLDMIKTRMQFQKAIGTPMYNNTWDCFRKILSNEGIRGLYRGLPAQIIGIAPEKAIKLTVNDVLRQLLTDKNTGKISILSEVLSGSVAGFSQVIITGPYELDKVRLQTQAQGHGKKSAITMVRELGFRGLFTGSGATLLRDVPFSAMYFTTYGNLKRVFTDKKTGHIGTTSVLAAGLLSGVVSAFLATPADVIKTRLQAKSEDGVVYKGIRDCFTRTLRDEGPRAFFKGAVPRILIISPLFGITLMVYETLKDYFLPPAPK